LDTKKSSRIQKQDGNKPQRVTMMRRNSKEMINSCKITTSFCNTTSLKSQKKLRNSWMRKRKRKKLRRERKPNKPLKMENRKGKKKEIKTNKLK